MDKQTFYTLFKNIFHQNGLEKYITPEITDRFYALTVRMLAVNEVMNITAIRDIDKIIPLHYADCVKIAHLFPVNATVLDVGCGGGFPILPLAIVRPDLQLTGIDSTAKKCRYVSETAQILDLPNVSTISARAEELIKEPNMRESFDVVTSRAVARLNILDELCLPFVKIGGQMMVMKGLAGDEELSEAINGIQTLGGDVSDTIHDVLWINNEISEQRTVITAQKVKNTPLTYPRQFGQIKKKPL